jgi:hypothetical protein
MRAAAEKGHAIGNSVGYVVPRPHGMLYLPAVKPTPRYWLELDMQLCNVFTSSTSVLLRVGVQYVSTAVGEFEMHCYAEQLGCRRTCAACVEIPW